MTYSKKRNIILATIIFLLGILAGGKIINEEQHLKNVNLFLVNGVIDGDTIKLANKKKVRLLGINSPEKGECFYNQGRDDLRDLILNKKVKLEKDITDQDIYGRWLRYVILEKENGDNLLVNDWLVRQGLAFDISSAPNNRYRNLLASAEEEAKREKRGL